MNGAGSLFRSLHYYTSVYTVYCTESPSPRAHHWKQLRNNSYAPDNWKNMRCDCRDDAPCRKYIVYVGSLCSSAPAADSEPFRSLTPRNWSRDIPPLEEEEGNKQSYLDDSLSFGCLRRGIAYYYTKVDDGKRISHYSVESKPNEVSSIFFLISLSIFPKDSVLSPAATKKPLFNTQFRLERKRRMKLWIPPARSQSAAAAAAGWMDQVGAGLKSL